MTTKLIAAYTDNCLAPQYINWSEDVERGVVVIVGREAAKDGEVYGRDFKVEVPKAEFAKMLMDAGTTWLFPVKRYRPRTHKPLGER